MTRPMLRPLTAITAALITLAPVAASAQEAAIYSSMDAVHPVWAKEAMVSVQEAVAAEVGLQVLKDGGNAVDAGVAVALALAVTLPRAGNLGG
ncbi:MAG: gamma-glutamyltransferase, partial [Alphaproteobacteria bacterium]|nr:gamma-glutamyltransferase [Alphaproteobacteria bacterium]